MNFDEGLKNAHFCPKNATFDPKKLLTFFGKSGRNKKVYKNAVFCPFWAFFGTCIGIADFEFLGYFFSPKTAFFEDRRYFDGNIFIVKVA